MAKSEWLVTIPMKATLIVRVEASNKDQAEEFASYVEHGPVPWPLFLRDPEYGEPVSCVRA